MNLLQTLGSTKLHPRGPKAVGRRRGQPKRKNDGSVADIVFVTVNEHETQALLSSVRAQTNADHITVATEERLYNDLGTINGTRIFHMICKMGSAGVGGSQEAVGQCIRELRPKAVLAVGIAFGVNFRRQKIGDVLVSTQLSLYDLQKVATAKKGKKKGIKIIPRGSKPDASPWPVNFFSTYHQTAWKGGTVQFGAILTGEKLVDNVDFRDQLIALEQEAIGGEMEGAGLYVSSTTNKTDWIVIKAICDWADGNKKRDKEARQKLAAGNAAAFVVGALSHAPFIGESPPAGVGRSTKNAGVFASIGSWRTGDYQIDQQLRELTLYDPSRDRSSFELLRLLRPLFVRAAFLPEPEGDWLSFAYVLSATRMLIQQCVNVVNSDDLRRKLRDVVKAIAALEGLTQKVLGDHVVLSAHAERFIADKRRYVTQLRILTNWDHAYSDPTRVEAIHEGNRQRLRALGRLEKSLGIAGLL